MIGTINVVTSMNVLSRNRMVNPFGVGSQMQKMFGFFLLNATPDCPCHEHAKQYDEWGPDLCLYHIVTIIDRLEEQASNRGIPFSRWVAERLVRIAIAKARRERPL